MRGDRLLERETDEHLEENQQNTMKHDLKDHAMCHIRLLGAAQRFGVRRA
jgi:hypothetical protein